ncbi:MAG TPA: hypothetical protein PK179_11625 [Spirochaetales bacterium]|nr:hypothetical protein [Spirochaetales bacterium]
MFRHLSIAVLAIIASGSLASLTLGAQEASNDPRTVEISGAFDLVSARAIGTGGATVAFVAAAGGEGGAASEAALDAALHALRSASVHGYTAYIMLFDPAPAAIPRASEPGDPLIREPSLARALADMGMDAVVLLDLGPSGGAMGNGSMQGPAVRAASLGMMTPRSVLEAVRVASRAAGLRIRESPVEDFYASAGLSPGSKALAPWLEAGLAAVAIESRPEDIETFAALAPAIAGAVAGQVAALVSEDSAVPGSDDVGYLRYPAPTGPVLVSDAAITLGTITTTALVAAVLALGLLNGRRRKASLEAVAKEAAGAFALSFIALFGARALSLLAASAVRALGDPTGPGSPSWAVAVALVLRVAGTLSLYYTASGLASRLGLHGDHRRIDAARASLGLLCLDALVAVVVFPPVAPFLLAAVIVSALASERAVGAAMGLVAVSLLALPFFDPRVIAAIGSARGAESVAQAMLSAGLRGNAVAAAFASPFGLWLNAASSPETRLRRGARIAPLWLVAAIVCAVGEAVLTASL